MDKNDKDTSQNPEKKTDLIIISPEELLKLGLFQDFSALVSSSTKDSPTASSSTTEKKSKTTPSKSARKRSRTPKHEVCFKKPEASPKILPSSKQPPVTEIQPIPPQKHPPQFSKVNPLPCGITHPTASGSGRPVLKKNLEHMKQILTESISQTHAISLAKKISRKKELKVISDNVVSFSSKELKDLIAKAKIKKDTSTEGSQVISGGSLYLTKPSSLIITSNTSTVTQNTSKDSIPKCEIVDSQQFNSSLSDIQDKELEISRAKQHADETKSAVSFNEYVEIAEENNVSDIKLSQEFLHHKEGLKYFDKIHSGKGQGETTKTSTFSNDIEPSGKDAKKQEEISSELQKKDFIPHQKEDNNSLQNSEVPRQEGNLTETKNTDTIPDQNENILFNRRRKSIKPKLVKRKKDVDHIPNHSLKEENSGEQSISGQQQNSSSTPVLLHHHSEGKEEVEIKTAESNLFPSELGRSRENSTEKIDCYSHITEHPKQEENTVVTIKEDSIVEKAKEEALIQVIGNQPFVGSSGLSKIASEFKSNIENPENKLGEHLVSKDLQDNSSSSVLSQDEGFVKYSSSDENKEIEKSDSFESDEKNSSRISKRLKQGENTTASVSKQNEKLLFSKRRRQPRIPLLPKIKRCETVNEIKNHSLIVETFSSATNVPELHGPTEISLKSPGEHPLSSELQDSSYISGVQQEKVSEIASVNLSAKEEIEEEAALPKELERSRELFTEQINNSPKIGEENIPVTKKIDSILDRKKRLHRKPILVARKKTQAEYINNNPVADTEKNSSKLNSTTDIETENPVEHFSNTDIETENPVEHLMSTEQLDSSCIPVSYRESSDIKEESKKGTKEYVCSSNVEPSGELCTEQTNYAPVISENLKQEENTSVTKHIQSILDRRRRQHRKPLLIDRKKNKADHTNNNPIAETSNTVKNKPELNSTVNVAREILVEPSVSTENLDSSSISVSCQESSNVKEESKNETEENVCFSNDSETSGELCTEQINYAPKISESVKQEENTNITKSFTFQGIKSQLRKTPLVARRRNKAVHTSNNPVADTSITVKNTFELSGTMDVETDNPDEHLLSTKQLESSSISISCQDKFYDLSKRLSTDVHEELKEGTEESVASSRKLEIVKDMFTELIDTAAEKSSLTTGIPLSKLVEDAESVSGPDVVKRRGRPRKQPLEISQLDESKESVGVLEKSADEVVSEIKNTVDETEDIKIVSKATEIEELSSNVMHCSTPVPKKRGRPKKNHPDANSTANEVILNDSSLLGNDPSDERKGKRSKENNSKNSKSITTLLGVAKSDDDTTQFSTSVLKKTSDCLLKVVKKRGRPKKNPLEEKSIIKMESSNIEIEEGKEHLEVVNQTFNTNEVTLNDSSLLGADKPDETTTQFFTSVLKETSDCLSKVVKKRGRPKKNPLEEKGIIKMECSNIENEEGKEHMEVVNQTFDTNKVTLNDSSLLGADKSDENTTQFSTSVLKETSDCLSKVVKKRGRPKKTPLEGKSIIKMECSNIDIEEGKEHLEVVNQTFDTNEVTLNDSSLLGADKSYDDTTQFSTSVLKETSDCLMKVVKKRGRPRKNPSEEKSKIKMESGTVEVEEGKKHLELANETFDALETSMKMETETVAEEGNKSSRLGVVNISAKTPRKCGRPRKTALDTTLSVEPAVSHTIEKSWSGRTRRKVNYLELELNSLRGENVELAQLDDDDDDESHSLDMSDDFIIPKKTRVYVRKIKQEVLDTVEDKSNKLTFLNDSMVDSQSPVGSNNSDASALAEKCADVPETSSDISEKCAAVPEASSDVSENNEATSASGGDSIENANSSIKSKYQWNGYTTQMMSSVFSAAFRGDPDNSVASSSSSPQEPIGKRRKGRPKKYVDDSSDNGVSDEKEVSCVVCEEKLPNSEWEYHNATMHYNLAWRKGQIAVNLDNDTVIKQKLKTVLRKMKTLACLKCGHSCKDLESFIIHREECLGILVNGLVTCAVCSSQMDRKSWLNHKLKIHNNLAWRVGDLPLDLNDQDYVLSVLNALYKYRIPLFCDKCQQSKKSVVGFLSHRSQCGSFEDAKIECKLCGKKVLPVSMPTHIKMIHETPKKNPNESDYFSVDPSASKKKRKAAKGAMMIIDSITGTRESKGPQVKLYKTNPVDFKEESYIVPLLERELEESLMIKCKFEDCSFFTDNVDSTLEHLNSCSKRPEEFHICTLCLLIRVLETDIRQHLTEVHDVFLPNEEDSGEEGFSSGEEHEMKQAADKLKKLVDTAKLKKCQRLRPLCISNLAKSTETIFNYAYKFNLEFCTENYSHPVLYDKFRHFAWNFLPSNLINNYLPVTDDSCDVARIKVTGFDTNVLAQEHTFKKFGLFDVERQDEHTTIFCGGPITAMAWAPTPYTSRDANQVLAVATTKDFDSKYRVNATYEEPSMIQFWDFGPLANRGPYPEPSKMLFLALDCGPIWHLEWCPSGCYDQEDSGQFQRLGLLAVAGSVPTVFIYSVPMIKDEEKRELFYKEEPLLKLQIDPSNATLKKNFYPTKISWTKASGHKYIAVGYSDGTVALFNVQSPSPLLLIREPDGGGVLLPYRVIPAHKHYISALSLVHLGGGDKLLLTGSYDRDVHLWNLDRRTKLTAPKRRIITDGTWLTNWLSYVTTSDDSNCINNLTSTIVTAYRNYLGEPTPIMFSKSSVRSITASDWLNGLVQGNEAGEVQVSFQGQMLYSLDMAKMGYLHRFLISYTKLIDKHKSPEDRVAEEAAKQHILTISPGGMRSSLSDFAENSNIVYNYFEPVTYAGASKKYGLVFCDLKLDSVADFPESFQKRLSGRHEVLGTSKPNLYALQAANKLCFNPNCQASLYFATGYQAGFVRVSYLKFLEKESQIRTSMK